MDDDDFIVDLNVEDDGLEFTETPHTDPAQLRREFGAIILKGLGYGIACALFFSSCTVTVKALHYFAGRCP